MGDSSDNIPGVPGVGEKTAQALLQGRAGWIRCTPSQKNCWVELPWRENNGSEARAKQRSCLLSYQLATIKTDVELELTCEQLEVQQPAAEELLGLFKKYEFKRWTADVEAGKWLQAKGAKPAAKPQETSVADEAPEVTATVISYDNYVTILDEEH
ncbi:5'-3' exonuclease H3TH domain-containing protein [Shigella flexneri]